MGGEAEELGEGEDVREINIGWAVHCSQLNLSENGE